MIDIPPTPLNEFFTNKMQELQDWALHLPPLPEGYHYRFELLPSYDLMYPETATMRAVPTKTLPFDDE